MKHALVPAALVLAACERQPETADLAAFGPSPCAEAPDPGGMPTDETLYLPDETLRVTRHAPSAEGVEATERFGAVREDGEVVLGATYALVRADEGRLVVACQGGGGAWRQDLLYGIVDGAGTEGVPARFSGIVPTPSGPVPVALPTPGGDQAWGYYDAAGGDHLAPVYLQAAPFSGDRALVRTPAGVFAIDRAGTPVSEPVPAEHLGFRRVGSGMRSEVDDALDGMRRVTVGSDPTRQGVMDRNGAWVVPPRYADVQAAHTVPVLIASGIAYGADGYVFEGGSTAYAPDGTALVEPQVGVSLYGAASGPYIRATAGPPDGTPAYRAEETHLGGLYALDGTRLLPPVPGADYVSPAPGAPPGTAFVVSGERGARVLAAGGAPLSDWHETRADALAEAGLSAPRPDTGPSGAE